MPGPEVDRLVAERRAELIRLKATGPPLVGYLCTAVPRELITALGAVPIRLAEGGSHDARARGERYVRVDACPFCKSCLGWFESDPLYKSLALVIAPTICDQMRRLPEAISHYFGVPVRQLALPRTTASPSTRNLFRHEVRELGRVLERLTGQGLTAEALSRAMGAEEEKRSLLRAVNQFRKQDPPTVSGSDMLRLVRMADWLRPEDAIRRLREHLRAGTRDQGSGNRERRPRLMLAGSIIADSDFGLIDMIEQHASIVADLLCTGMRSFLLPLSVPVNARLDQLLTVLADYYFDRTDCIHRRPNTGYYRSARQVIDEFGVAGTIYKTLLYCDGHSLEAVRLRRELKVPLLHIDTDYGEGNVEQMRTRLEAFLEALMGERGNPKPVVRAPGP